MPPKPATILCRKVGAALHPADVVSDEYIAELPQGAELHMKVWLPRNPKFHRAAMGYLSMVADNNDVYPDLPSLMNWLLSEMGMFDTFVGHTGLVSLLMHSVSYSAMDEVHFKRFMRRAECLINDNILNLGIDDYVNFKKEVAKSLSLYEGERRA